MFLIAHSIVHVVDKLVALNNYPIQERERELELEIINNYNKKRKKSSESDDKS